MMARICNETEIEREVVDAGNLHGKELLGLEEMVQVGLGGNLVDVAAVWIHWTEIHLPLLVAHVHRTIIGKEHRIAAVAGWHYAVEHINTALDGLEQVLGSSYAHQVARLVLWQNLIHHLDHFVHHLGRLAYGKTADGISVGSLVGNVLGCFAAQLWESTTLDDREEALLITVERFCLVEALDAAVEPALGHLQTLLRIHKVALSGRTLIESHHDVGTDDAFCIHHVLWSEEMLAAIDVGTELAALFSELADSGKREYLEAAAVGEDRAVPAVELMQSACRLDDFESRAQVEMVGVSQDDLGLYLLAQFFEMYTLYAAHSSHRHEDRSLDLSVVGGDDAGASIACLICYL